MREKGLEPSRPKTQVPKTCVSAISPLPLERSISSICATGVRVEVRGTNQRMRML